MFRFCLALGIATVGFAQASAEIIDLDSRLQSVLAQTQKELMPPPRGGASTPLGGAPIWFVSKPFVVSAQVTKSEVRASAIPSSIKRSVYLQRNCTMQEQKVNENLSVDYTVGRTTTLTVGVRSSNKIDVKIPTLNLGFGQDVSLDTSSSTVSSESTKHTETQKIEVGVPSATARLFILEKRLSNGFLDFAGTVIADAQVVFKKANGEETPPLGLVSKVVPEDKRRFKIEGQIWNVTADQRNFTYIDKKLDLNDPKQCPQFDINNGDLLNVNTASGSKIEVAVVDGMTIEVADVVANVEMRAQSLGPGFCATEVGAGQSTIGIAAPPHSWSDWYDVASHLGRAKFTLSTRIICDTGALFQVRYYK